MAEYIERDSFLAACGMAGEQIASFVRTMADASVADVVSRRAYNQVMWERDIAIAQLSEIGKGFGQKMDDVKLVVFCRDCENYHYNEKCGMNKCDLLGAFLPTDWYCKGGTRRCET